MSLLCFVIGVISCLLLQDKRPSNQQDRSTDSKLVFKEMFDFSIAKNWRFLLWVFTDTLLEAGYNVPYFFLPCKYGSYTW